MLLDYHMHTTLSDGNGKHEDYVAEAIKKGINEIGFSDHICTREINFAGFSLDVPLMVKAVKDVKEKSDIPVKLGGEFDFFPEDKEKIKAIIDSNPFDYTIGSIHFVNDVGYSDLKNILDYNGWKIDQIYPIYFDLVNQAIESKLFDFIGHIDLIKVFGIKPKKDITHIFRNTAQLLKKNNVGIEINSSGLIRPCNEIYPSKKFLKICFDENVPITFGSDAHRPEHVGRFFDQVVQLVKGVGYTEIVQFEERKRKFVEI